MNKPTNLPAASAALWDRIDAAMISGDMSRLPGMTQYATSGSVHVYAVQRALAGAANAGLDPVAHCNKELKEEPWEIVGYYMVLVTALQAQGFGTAVGIKDTTRPLT